MAVEVAGFSKRFAFGLVTIVALVTLVIYFYSVILYGTGCPSISSTPVSVKYGERTFSFTSFYCYNPAKWANPITQSDQNATNPNNIFLGICVLPPGWTMLAGIVYFLVYGFFYLIGLLGTFKSPEYLAVFLYWVWRALVLNIVVLVLNSASALFFLIREGQNDYAANPTWICSGFSQLGWNFCGYVTAQFVFFVVFTILNAVSFHLVKEAIQDAEGDDEVGVFARNNRRRERPASEIHEGEGDILLTK